MHFDEKTLRLIKSMSKTDIFFITEKPLLSSQEVELKKKTKKLKNEMRYFIGVWIEAARKKILAGNWNDVYETVGESYGDIIELEENLRWWKIQELARY